MGKDLKGRLLGTGLSQRKDGRYEARFMINGRSYSLYDLSLKELKKKMEQKKAELLISKTTPERISVSEWFERWFEVTKAPMLKSDVSRASYKRKCKSTYINILGEIQLADLTQFQIQLATNELRDKYRKKYVSEGLGVLRECLDIAVINHMIAANPCVSINIKNDEYIMNERSVFTKKQQDMILDFVSGSYYEEVYKFLLLTGMRIGEFTGLQWNDIDWDKKQIHIERSMTTGYVDHKKIEQLTAPKTYNSVRTIPFFGETEAVLKSWCEKQRHYRARLGSNWRTKEEHGDLVFTSTQGSPVSRYIIIHDMNRVEKNLRAIYGEGNVPHIHPHAFRHTFATRCFEKGMDPIIVQKLMGHVNYTTTVGYTHVSDTLDKAVRAVGNFL